ncbi:MAG: glucose-6-phosphate isomerase, partial [Moraxellaceae bacterium]|nr:glucose-6-phosphate isomerase [Moraxellaceae bacterium]
SLDYATCPVLWGEVGSNAQHAFYQLLHQGTQAVSSDFIAPVRRYHDRTHNQALIEQHQLALANCLAQSRVLMLGDAAIKDGKEAPDYRRYHGNQPSSTLLLDELNPYSLGALIALYEHKVFVMSVIWNINPFDQWGVELGKVMATGMLSALQSAHIPDVDASSAMLLREIIEKGGRFS